MNQNNNLYSKPFLIFTSSGASYVGELAVKTARRMARSGLGKMFCQAIIKGRIQHFIDDAQSAEEIIIIDGCSNVCAKIQ